MSTLASDDYSTLKRPHSFPNEIRTNRKTLARTQVMKSTNFTRAHTVFYLSHCICRK